MQDGLDVRPARSIGFPVIGLGQARSRSAQCQLDLFAEASPLKTIQTSELEIQKGVET
jgi:hypothetical protein